MTPVQHRVPGETFAGYTQLVSITCYKCGVLFAVPEVLNHFALRDHNRDFWCPNGHQQHYIGKTEAQKLSDRLREEREYSARISAQRDQAQAAARVQKGRATRFKNERDRVNKRVANGVCPVCNRSFKNLHRHMCGQHPGFADSGE